MRDSLMAFLAMCVAANGLALTGCPGGVTIDDDDDDVAGPPFDVEALSCEHAFVNERVGGLHYWLLDLQADGSFEASFPNSPGDAVTGTYDVATGALTASVTFDAGYKVTGEEVEGTVTFEGNGDMTAETTVVFTYLDGFVETQQRTSQQVGCIRGVEYTSEDRHGDAVTLAVETEITGDMTADETVDGDLGGHTTLHFQSQLNEDFSRDDAIEYDDLETAAAPDQEIDRTLLGDGTGSGTYVALRDEGRIIAGEWDYHANGDYEGDWELDVPDAPTNPVAWGHTYNSLDLSGSSEYTRLGQGGVEVQCTSEWDTEGHGLTECDDGTYEEF